MEDVQSSRPPVEVEAESSRYVFSPDLVTLSDGRDSEAEAVRTIRTHVIARHLNDGRRGLAVCGPRPGVGTTFTAANLAVAMSQVAVSTLLIDANLRKPGLREFIRPEGEQRVTPTNMSAVEQIHSDVLPNLSILYAEGLASDAEDLLGGEKFRRLMDRCLRDFEFTIVDTSPASESSDVLRVASIVGYALVVARANVSLIKDVDALSKELQDDGARIIGAVLNRA